MNKQVLDRLTRKMRRDNRDSRDYADNRDNRDRRDYADNRDYEDERDYEDGRRGVRGSGRSGRSRDNRDYEDGNDYEDYYDRDYGKPLRLSKSDIHRWKKKLENVDGTHGEHYDMDQVMQVAERIGVKFNHFDEREYCLLVNVMYSDYCKVVRKHIPPEKELVFYAELAKAFLDDPDGPEPSEKLALYFHCIADAE